IVRRESRSFASYIADAYPWTTAAGGPALGRLRQAFEEESEAVSALGRYLARQRVPMPFMGAYPVSFTSTNFLSLEYLVPRLIEAQKQLIAALQADLKRIEPGEPRARAEALL